VKAVVEDAMEPLAGEIDKFAKEVRAAKRLKRLASAVQLRPWPPCFQSLACPESGSVAAIGCNSQQFLSELVDTAAKTAQLLDHSLLTFGHELLVDIQSSRCFRVPHLTLRVLHVRTGHFQPHGM
jgi:hypothetical protein